MGERILMDKNRLRMHFVKRPGNIAELPTADSLNTCRAQMSSEAQNPVAELRLPMRISSPMENDRSPNTECLRIRIGGDSRSGTSTSKEGP